MVYYFSDDGQQIEINVAAVESGTDGWSATGANISRVSNSTVWWGSPTTDAGGTPNGVLRATSTGTGPTTVFLSASYLRPIMTGPPAYPWYPGEEYTWAVWAVTVSRAATSTAKIEWIDGTGTVIETATQAWSLPSTTVSRRVSVRSVMPATAVAPRLSIVTTNTASGQDVYFDDAFFGLSAAPNLPDNLLTVDEYHLEAPNSDGLFGVSHGTLSRDPNCYINEDAFDDGTTLLKAVPDGTGVMQVWPDRYLPITGGETYSFRTPVILNQAGNPTATITMRVRVEWYDDAEALIGLPLTTPWATSTNTGTWISQAQTLTAEAPLTATKAILTAEVDPAGSTATAYHYQEFSALLGAEEYVATVFEAEGYIQVDIPALPTVETTRLTVWRVHDDGAQAPVRTYDGDSVDLVLDNLTALTLEDYEAPVGMRVWYRSIRHDTGITRVERSTDTVTAPGISNADYIWFKSPGLPALSIKAIMESPIAWQSTTRAAVYDVVGRANPIVISEVRSGQSGTVTLRTETDVENNGVRALLALGLPLLIQAAPGLGIPSNLYVSVGDAASEPLTRFATDPDRRWSLAVREIDRPTGALQGTRGRTWGSVNNDPEDLWSDLLERFTSWTGVLTDIDNT